LIRFLVYELFGQDFNHLNSIQLFVAGKVSETCEAGKERLLEINQLLPTPGEVNYVERGR
jgi:hypothetical protein